MALSASAPLVAMWDDHEIANNEWIERRGGSSDGSRGEIRRSRASGDSRVPRVVTHARTHGELVDKQNARGGVQSNGALRRRGVVRGDGDATRGAHRSQRRPGGERLRERVDGRFHKTTPAPARLARKRSRATHCAASRRVGGVSEVTTRMLGAAQTRWIERETRASRDAGVRWQVSRRRAPVMRRRVAGRREGAAALDARRDAPKPPGGYTSLASRSERGPRGTTTTRTRVWIRSRRRRAAASVASARALLLASAGHGINWNFDDWRGYVAERERFLRAGHERINRALVLGGTRTTRGRASSPRTRAGLGRARANGIRTTTSPSARRLEFDVPA